MKVRILLTVLFLAIVASGTAFGQRKGKTGSQAEADPLNPGGNKTAIYFGPVVGYNKSLHTVDLATFATDPLCPFFTNGDGNGFYVGFMYEQMFGAIENSIHSVRLKVIYNTFPAYLEKVGKEYPSLVSDGQGGYTTVNSATTHTVDVDYSVFSIEPTYKFIIAKVGNENAGINLGVIAGPTFDMVMTSTLTQKFMLTKPDNARFIENEDYQFEDASRRTMIIYDGDIEEASSFRFGLKAGLLLEIGLPGPVDLIPIAQYNFGITQLTSKEDWRVDALQIGFDIRYALSF